MTTQHSETGEPIAATPAQKMENVSREGGMTLREAITAIKDSMYALFVYREPEPFSYVRDVDELTDFTSTPTKE